VDKDEALKLALEALETHGAPLLNHEDAYSASLTALRQAIEEAEKQEYDDLTIAYLSGVYDGKNKYAPQPKPEPKPHVWFKTGNGWRKEEFEKTLVKKVPLDTTPPEPKPHVWFDFSNCDRYSSKEEFEKTLLNNVPQREWIGLTVREIEWCFYDANDAQIVAARNIESKLREKNT